MYADDFILLSESEIGLQNCIKNLNVYNERWKMSINMKKTKILVFQKYGKKIKPNIYLGNNKVEVTDSYVYLGVIFSDTGSFVLAQKSLYEKILKSNFWFFSHINSHNGAGVTLFCKLFDS